MKSIFFLSLFFFLVSCSDENPFVSKDVIRQIDQTNNPDVKNVVVIFENDIYYFENITGDADRLTFTPSEKKSDVKLSHDHTKIAYLDEDKSPVVINRNGTVIDRPVQFSAVKQMGWSADDKTLWMLIGNAISFFGPDMNIPSVTFPSGISFASEKRILSLSVSPAGEVAYVWRYFTNHYWHTLIHKKKNGTETREDFTIHDQLIYVDFSSNGDIVYGYNSNENSRVFEKVKLLDKNGVVPVIDEVHSSIYSNPIFRSDVGYLMLGQRKDFDTKFTLATFSMTNSENNKNRPDFFNTASSGLSLDWK